MHAPSTWRDLDEQTIKALFTSETGCWTVSDRVRTEHGSIVLDERPQDEPLNPNERKAYRLTALTVSRYAVEAWTVMVEGQKLTGSLVSGINRAIVENRICQQRVDALEAVNV